MYYSMMVTKKEKNWITTVFTIIVVLASTTFIYAISPNGIAQHVSSKLTNDNATFTDTYSDFVIDNNMDGYDEFLVINVGIDVTVTGNYTISTFLYDNNNMYVTSAVNLSTFASGHHDVTLSFNGTHIYLSNYNGSFKLVNLYLRNETGYTLDYRKEPYTTNFYNYTDFQKPNAYFTGAFMDYGVDVDGNGLFEYIAMVTEINTVSLGNHTIICSLYSGDSSETFIDYATNYTILDIGVSDINLFFGYTKICYSMHTGFFVIKDLRIYDESSRLISWTNTEYNTSSYTPDDFEIPATNFTYHFEDHGLDSDSDGLYDYLTVDVGVNIEEEGIYTLLGYLYNQHLQVIAYATNTTQLHTRTQTVSLNFDGRHIWQTKQNNYFYLLSVTLYDSTNTPIRKAEYAHLTNPYSYMDFECSYVAPTDEYVHLGVDIDDDGLFDYLRVEITMQVTESGQYSVIGYMDDANGNFVGFTETDTYLNTGTSNVTLNFDGSIIHKKGLTSVLNVSLIEIYKDGVLTSWAETSYLIPGYNWTQFSPYPASTLLPDIVIMNVTCSNWYPKHGETVLFYVTIKNIGRVPGTNINVALYVDSIRVNENTVHLIYTDKEAVVALVWNAEGGGHVIEVVVDPDSTLSEIDEENNKYNGSISVEEKPGMMFDPIIILIVALTIIIAIVLAGTVLSVKGIRKQKTVIVKCKKCGETIRVASAKRPLNIVCPKCGAKGTLK